MDFDIFCFSSRPNDSLCEKFGIHQNAPVDYENKTTINSDCVAVNRIARIA